MKFGVASGKLYLRRLKDGQGGSLRVVAQTEKSFKARKSNLLGILITKKALEGIRNPDKLREQVLSFKA